MATAFIQIGNHWVNLELVIGIELLPDPHDPAKIIAARVHYTTDKHQDFPAQADIQALVNWLRSHKAS
jgi:hypothetical protein